MVDYNLDHKQRFAVDLARKFRIEHVEGKFRSEYEVERPEERFPYELVRISSQAGLRTLAVSEEYGGLGADGVSLCLAEEELSYGDMGVGVIFAQTWKIARAIERSANRSQKDDFLKRFVKDPEMVLSIAGTEESGGSDIWIPYNAPNFGVHTTARLEGEEWVINGKKSFISNAPQSKMYVLLARTDSSAGTYEGTSLFLVEKDTPGVSIGKVHDKLGEKLTSNGEIIFDNARLPKSNLLSKVNGAYSEMLPFYALSNPLAGATALGTARRAYDTALEFAKKRIVGGKPMIEQQAVGVEFVEMLTLLEASEDLILKAAWAFDHEDIYDAKLGWMSKIFATEASFKICTKALELQAHSGIIFPGRAEKCLRDSAVFLHSDGANLALKIKIWNAMRGMKYTL